MAWVSDKHQRCMHTKLIFMKVKNWLSSTQSILYIVIYSSNPLRPMLDDGNIPSKSEEEDVTGSDNIPEDQLMESLRKSRFDDRAITRLNVWQGRHKRINDALALLEHSGDNSNYEFVKWAYAEYISKRINLPDYFTRFGSPTVLEPSGAYIAIGTNKGYVMVYGYHQEEYFVLDHHEDGAEVEAIEKEVTCIGFSSDSSLLAAGYNDGSIVVWSLVSKTSEFLKPYYVIQPTSLVERFTNNIHAHLQGIPISYVSFVGMSHNHLISLDMSGLVFYHFEFKKFLTKHIQTHKILGINDSNSFDITRKHSIRACQTLPVGTSDQITDYLGVTAVIGGSSLIIVTTLSLDSLNNSLLKVLHKESLGNNFKAQQNKRAHLHWYPCTSLSNGSVQNARLLYGWNRSLSILEIKNDSFPKNLLSVIKELKQKDKAISSLPIQRKCVWNVPNDNESIVAAKWVSSTMICAFLQRDDSSEMRVVILHYQTRKESSSLVLASETHAPGDVQASVLTLRSNGKDMNQNTQEIKEVSYKNSMKVFKERIMYLSRSEDGKSSVVIGRLLNWADNISACLSKKFYYKSLSLTFDLYSCQDHKLIDCLGLPVNSKERKRVLHQYLIQIMKQSLPSILTQIDQEEVIKLYLKIIAVLYEDIADVQHEMNEILDALYDNLNDKRLFFELLEPYLLDALLPSLPPSIFKSLVEHYASEEDIDAFTNIVCSLDSSALDIDLVMRLCTKYELEEPLTYVTSHVLNDYTSPLLHFISSISAGKEAAICYHVYPYLSFILTGREYPTGTLMEVKKANAIKNKLCNIIFCNSNSNIVEEANSFEIHLEAFIFPYLTILLKYSSFEMLSTLNEVMEDSFFNEDNGYKFNRQYIVDSLCDVFESKEADFDEEDRCNWAIFVGRNYTKYPQFIRLSEDVLNRVVDALCSNNSVGHKNDRELALQSIISVYETPNSPLFREKLRAAKMFRVLFGMYRQDGDAAEAMDSWLEQHRLGDEPGDAEPLSVLSNVYTIKQSTIQLMRLNEYIAKNFEEICKIDVKGFVSQISRHNPKLHENALHIQDSSVFSKYCKVLFSENNRSVSVSLRSSIVSRYITQLCEEDSVELYAFVSDNMTDLADNGDDFERAKRFLEQRHSYDALSLFYIHKGMYREALEALLCNMRRQTERLEKDPDQESLEKVLESFERSFRRALDACCIDQACSEAVDQGDLNEALWLSLLEACTSASNRAREMATFQQAPDESRTDIRAFFDHCVNDAFRTLSQTKLSSDKPSASGEKSFLRVFSRFLDHCSVGARSATLANVRDILTDLFVSYTYDTEFFGLALRLLDSSIHGSMHLIRLDLVAGWSLASTSCAACSKPLWGPCIPSEHYHAWVSHQKHVLLAAPGASTSHTSAAFDNHSFPQCETVVFKCLHAYHSTCLINLSSSASKKCILCCE
ncbi:Piso0_001452 [Millerozyma farinosa CBS 7064]|uniref:Piso0_001452 protein n=1 Tax=Pichia sorbitophila (strain ATCC MYA-4447 / BCRC 22081 / CBS 7064 / NBRC 10061 / NRRL Y-12695) TaxID=559304 RepID=G8YN74_PICSO|nr:Piso0_001452 [Millerozyma farinosa CBS 7064]